MIDVDRAAEVKRSVLFHGLPAKEIGKIADDAEVRHLKRGRAIFQQGNPAMELLLLVDGWVKVTHVTPKGDSIGLRFLQRGEHLACQAVFRDVPLPATATAASDCMFLVWKTPYVRDILKRQPVVSQNALEIVGDRLNDFLGTDPGTRERAGRGTPRAPSRRAGTRLGHENRARRRCRISHLATGSRRDVRHDAIFREPDTHLLERARSRGARTTGDRGT